MLDVSRRSFFTGVAALLAAPALVRASSLMPLRGELLLPELTVWEIPVLESCKLFRVAYKIVVRVESGQLISTEVAR